MPAVTKRQIKKVVERAGYELLGIDFSKHVHLTIGHHGRTAKVVMSLTPQSSMWPTWVVADIKRAFKSERIR